MMLCSILLHDSYLNFFFIFCLLFIIISDIMLVHARVVFSIASLKRMYL